MNLGHAHKKKILVLFRGVLEILRRALPSLTFIGDFSPGAVDLWFLT